MIWIILTVIALYALYKYRSQNNDFFKKMGVPHLDPWFGFGNMFLLNLRLENLSDVLARAYYRFPNTRYTGIFNFTAPILIVKDPEVIKQILVKNFDHFVNRFIIISEEIDPLFAKSLVGLNDQKWKDMRATLSPAFTSSKMKSMFILVDECAIKVTQHFENECTHETKYLVKEMKDLFTRYTNDVIASTAFGVEIDSLKNPKNEFFTLGNELMLISFSRIIKFIGYGLMPEVMKKLGISIFNKHASNYFRNLIIDTMKMREDNNMTRPDMIQILMDLKKGHLKQDEDDKNEIDNSTMNTDRSKFKNQNLTEDDLIAQAFIFFLAGFDTSSNALTFFAYEIATNPDIQKKLLDEIDEVMEKNDNKLSYEIINSMKYLDMALSETLRKWNPAGVLDRLCNKSLVVPGIYTDQNGSEFTIQSGVDCWIPMLAIHMDPQYYPDPEKFQPERFSDENKQNMHQFTYLAFGAGPRNCIGSRYALMQTKTILVRLMSKFSFVVCEKTIIPPKVNQFQFNMKVVGGMWIGLQPRKM